MLPQRILRSRRFDLIHMGIGILNGLICHDKIGCCFLSNPRHTRYIIGRISHQCFHINKFFRRYLIPFFHICGIIVFNLRATPFCLRYTDFNMFRSKLQQISVSGYDYNFQSFGFTTFSDSSQQIIGFVTCLFHCHDTHGMKNLFHQRHLLPQLRSHRLSRTFISVKHFVAERRCMNVKCNSKIIWFFFFQYFQHDIQKTIHCICMEALRIGQIRNAKKCPAQNTVSIYQYDLFAHTLRPSCLSV